MRAEALIGWPVWYRKDFRLRDFGPATSWRIRFEAVNHRAAVWLNGRRIGAHTGGFEPFELRLRGVRRGGVNRLVVRTDNRRRPTDFPPAVFTRSGKPRGGWWNYGGIVRDVYLRAVDRIDFSSVQASPRVACARCPATVDLRIALRNDSKRDQRMDVRGAIGPVAFDLGPHRIGANRTRVLKSRVSVDPARPWSPHDPFLYPVRLDALALEGQRPVRVARHRFHIGLREVRVSDDGRLLLNGSPVKLRGAAVFDDLPGKGAALTRRDHARTVAQVKDLGATLVRSHYPLSQAFHELADRNGILVWSEIPVYQVEAASLRRRSVREVALERLEANIAARGNHASVLLWSIANELKNATDGAVRAYVRAAARLARRLDPTRPVAIAIAGRPRDACRPGYEPLDVIGINDYFGWYEGDVADREQLSPYLDRMRACHRSQALLISEFGAEANRPGPAQEKGTYDFQREFVRFHLGVFAGKEWLSGASYWTLREYMIRPGWTGGNPVALPPGQPLHQKGVISYDGSLKPAYADLRESYRATAQVTR